LSIIAGIHAVKHALESGDPMAELMIEKGKKHPRLDELIHLARKKGIRVLFQPRQALERLSEGVPHQGVVARMQHGKRLRFEDWLEGLDKTVTGSGLSVPRTNSESDSELCKR